MGRPTGKSANDGLVKRVGWADDVKGANKPTIMASWQVS